MSGASELLEEEVHGEAFAAPGGMRDAVLHGRFLGSRHAVVAEEVAAFVARPAAWIDLANWFGDALAGLIDAGPDAVEAALLGDIARLDAMISRQLDAVLHAAAFQALEGRWRGLAWLVGGIEAGRRVKVRVCPIAWPEICRDLERAAEFDQSHLFRRIYEDEFGMPGGEPFGLMVIDHALRHRPAPGAPTDDVGTVGRLASIAAASFTPMVLSLHPAVLEVESFGELETVRDATAPLRDADHARWRALAGRADLRFVAVTLPRLLARLPHADDPARALPFRYREHAPTAASRCWMGAGFAFAACAARAFAQHGWPADVRGVDTDRIGGGLVTGVPPEPVASGPALAWPRTGIEFSLSDAQERALVELGMMPVTALPYGSDLVFGTTRSMQAPASYTGANAAVASANARLSAQLNSILCASRFAHLIKVMGRDMVGSFQTAAAIEGRLQRWLQGYVDTNLRNTGESRARSPLVAGEVRIEEKRGRPGVFGAIIRLQPHYQLDDVASVFSLVTELAAPGAR